MSILDKRPIRLLGSLRLSLWLLGAQTMLFCLGAVQMPRLKAYSQMNSVALLSWMQDSPLMATWWLWASVGIISILALNTIICSIESLIKKRQGRQLLLVVSPQVIHLGFLLMMAGHLASGAGAVHSTHAMAEGSAIMLPGGNVLRLSRVDLQLSPRGYPTDWSAELEYFNPAGQLLSRGLSAPNRPSLRNGTGVYIKEAAYGGALIEVHREPGAPWALAGGGLFVLGTLSLLALKTKREL